MEKKHTTLSEQFQNLIENSLTEATSMPLICEYMTAYFPCLVRTLQLELAGLNWFY